MRVFKSAGETELFEKTLAWKALSARIDPAPSKPACCVCFTLIIPTLAAMCRRVRADPILAPAWGWWAGLGKEAEMWRVNPGASELQNHSHAPTLALKDKLFPF